MKGKTHIEFVQVGEGAQSHIEFAHVEEGEEAPQTSQAVDRSVEVVKHGNMRVVAVVGRLAEEAAPLAHTELAPAWKQSAMTTYVIWTVREERLYQTGSQILQRSVVDALAMMWRDFVVVAAVLKRTTVEVAALKPFLATPSPLHSRVAV